MVGAGGRGGGRGKAATAATSRGPVGRPSWVCAARTGSGGESGGGRGPAARQICTLWDRGGGSSSGENKGATGPAEKLVSAGVEQRNSPSEERGPTSSREWSTPETRRSTSVATSVLGIQRNPPRAGPQPGISVWPLPSCQSRFHGDGGCAPPSATFPGKRGQSGRAFRQWRRKVPHPSQSASSGRGAVAPIFQKLTIEAPQKQPLPPPLLQRIAGSGDPSALQTKVARGATGPELPSSRRPRKGWRGHGCKVLGFFSLLDMNKGIRTASFRRSLGRTKGPAVRAAQSLIKRQSPVTQHRPRYLCS